MKDIITDETRRIAREEVRSESGGMDEDTFKAIFEYDSDIHSEEIFKCKMYLFTLDVVKNGSKGYRTKVRRAENILDLCKLYDAEKRRVERTGYYSNNKEAYWSSHWKEK